MQILIKALKQARAEKMMREEQDALNGFRQREDEKKEDGEGNKAEEALLRKKITMKEIFTDRKKCQRYLIIMPEDSFKGLWDILITV